jgi:hypothetical protein
MSNGYIRITLTKITGIESNVGYSYYGCRDSIVGNVTRIRAGRSGFRILAETR